MQVDLTNMEAFVQLTVALNFAFAAFESLRSPVQAKMRRLASGAHQRCLALSTELRDLHYISTFGWPRELSEPFRCRSSDYSKVNVHEQNLRGYQTAFEQSNEDWSFSAGRFAIIVGVVGLAILFYIPISNGLFLSMPVYLLLSAFLLCPTALLIFYNLLIGRMMRDEVKIIEAIRQEIFEIEGRLKSDYRPIFERAKEAKLISEH